MEQQLKPIYDRLSYHHEAEKNIGRFLYDLLFGPIIDILADARATSKENSKASFLSAVKAGRIWYRGGLWKGEFNASISKYLREQGARWDKVERGFRLGWTALTPEARRVVEGIQAREREVRKRLEKHLAELKTKSLTTFDIETGFRAVMGDLEKQFRKTTADSISVQPVLSKEAERRLAERYINNLDLYVQGWTDEAIVRLRKKMGAAAMAGVRAEDMAKIIESEWGVSRRKAKFLARQETSLMVSKFREERYGEAGVTMYRWETSHDERVRQDHKDLNGRIFKFKEPPITDRATGQRNNPGEDFNCRCIAIPILKGVKA